MDQKYSPPFICVWFPVNDGDFWLDFEAGRRWSVVGSGMKSVCMCEDFETAKMIADALNEKYESK